MIKDAVRDFRQQVPRNKCESTTERAARCGDAVMATGEGNRETKHDGNDGGWQTLHTVLSLRILSCTCLSSVTSHRQCRQPLRSHVEAPVWRLLGHK